MEHSLEISVLRERNGERKEWGLGRERNGEKGMGTDAHIVRGLITQRKSLGEASAATF